MLCLCTSPPTAISAQGIGNIWLMKNICCDGRNETSSNAVTAAAKRDTVLVCVHFFFSSTLCYSKPCDRGWTVPMDNGAITACQISNPTHPQLRQDASKRPQPSCWEWVAALALLNALTGSPRVRWGWGWGEELRLQLAMSMKPVNRKGAGGWRRWLGL